MKLEFIAAGNGAGEKNGDMALRVLRPAGRLVHAVSQHRNRVDAERRRNIQAMLKEPAAHRGQLRVELHFRARALKLQIAF